VPRLKVDCNISAGAQAFVSVNDGLGVSTAFVVFGLIEGSASMGSGCSLLVQPLLPLVLSLPLGGGGAGAGSAFINAFVPASSSGVQFTAQVLVQDPASPTGYANSAGQSVTIG